MVSLHIAKLLEDEGFGTLETDLFWENIPLDSNSNPVDGLWVVTRGSTLDRFNTTTQQFDVYSRFSNPLTGSKKLEGILEFLKEAYGEVCELPTVPPYSLTIYDDVRLRPISGIENVGVDAQEKIVRLISGEVQYNIRGEI